MVTLDPNQDVAPYVINADAYTNPNVTLSVLIDKSPTGTGYAPVKPDGTLKLFYMGYDVFDVNGATLSHYKRTIGDPSKGWSVDPQQRWSLAAVPEPATLGLLAMGGLAMLRRRK